mgnify:FL=1|jgi:hypothetical protein
MYAKVKDHNHLIRDMNSKAVLNTDKAGLNDYMMKRDIAKKQQEEQSETKMRLAQLEEDMTEIKNLLIEIAGMRKT